MSQLLIQLALSPEQPVAFTSILPRVCKSWRQIVLKCLRSEACWHIWSRELEKLYPFGVLRSPSVADLRALIIALLEAGSSERRLVFLCSEAFRFFGNLRGAWRIGFNVSIAETSGHQFEPFLEDADGSHSQPDCHVRIMRTCRWFAQWLVDHYTQDLMEHQMRPDYGTMGSWDPTVEDGGENGARSAWRWVGDTLTLVSYYQGPITNMFQQFRFLFPLESDFGNVRFCALYAVHASMWACMHACRTGRKARAHPCRALSRDASCHGVCHMREERTF